MYRALCPKWSKHILSFYTHILRIYYISISILLLLVKKYMTLINTKECIHLHCINIENKVNKPRWMSLLENVFIPYG